MSARILSFFRPASALQDDWSQQELAEFYRVEAATVQAGLRISTDRGQSDEGDPWFVFCRAQDESVFLHVARFDGHYWISGDGIVGVLRGPNFRALLTELIGTHATFLPLPAQGSAGKILLHPAALLAAIVATACLVSMPSEVIAREAGTSDTQPVAGQDLVLEDPLHLGDESRLFGQKSDKTRFADSVNAERREFVGSLVLLAASIAISMPEAHRTHTVGELTSALFGQIEGVSDRNVSPGQSEPEFVRATEYRTFDGRTREAVDDAHHIFQQPGHWASIEFSQRLIANNAGSFAVEVQDHSSIASTALGMQAVQEHDWIVQAPVFSLSGLASMPVHVSHSNVTQPNLSSGPKSTSGNAPDVSAASILEKSHTSDAPAVNATQVMPMEQGNLAHTTVAGTVEAVLHTNDAVANLSDRAPFRATAFIAAAAVDTVDKLAQDASVSGKIATGSEASEPTSESVVSGASVADLVDGNTASAGASAASDNGKIFAHEEPDFPHILAKLNGELTIASQSALREAGLVVSESSGSLASPQSAFEQRPSDNPRISTSLKTTQSEAGPVVKIGNVEHLAYATGEVVQKAAERDFTAVATLDPKNIDDTLATRAAGIVNPSSFQKVADVPPVLNSSTIDIVNQFISAVRHLEATVVGTTLLLYDSAPVIGSSAQVTSLDLPGGSHIEIVGLGNATHG